MILQILRVVYAHLVNKVTPRPRREVLSPTDKWLRQKRAEFKAGKLKKGGKLDLRFNPLAMDDGPCCFPVRDGTKIEGLPDDPDQSEELAFLEWMEQQGISLPKKAILENDNRWRQMDLRYNPLTNTEDHFLHQRDAS